MPSDSDRLLATGAPITLTDGRIMHIRFGFRALKALEDEFDSLEDVQEVLDSIEGGRGKKFGPLVKVIASGLSHEHLSSDELLDLLDIRRLDEYATAIGDAFAEAFPSPEAEAPKAQEATVVHLPPGPGASGTTPPPSSSDAPTGTSG